MKNVNFAVIGCGLMGREFASVSMRWLHLLGELPRPVILAAVDLNDDNLNWFRQVPDTKYFYHDYKEMLENPEIEAVYCAVPHHLHAKVYCDVIRAGKHLIGEKPFGMDLEAMSQIEQAMAEHPEVFVRCASEFPFYPAVQQMVKWYCEGAYGQIIEAKFAIKHSSDMDLKKPINWKRMRAANGEYGCMGDLGIHTQHLPFRLGFKPKSVGAYLSNIAKERLDQQGNMVPCETWDNAVLMCQTVNDRGDEFPMRLEMKRMAPGCTNTVEYEIYGVDMSAKFTSDDPNAIHYTLNMGREQAWARLVIGQKTQFPVITGSIFEFGFSDSLLQMFAAFVSELRGLPCEFGCFRPEEAHMSHELLTAALESQKEQRIIPLTL